jgi:hypothetical protein
VKEILTLEEDCKVPERHRGTNRIERINDVEGTERGRLSRVEFPHRPKEGARRRIGAVMMERDLRRLWLERSRT